uniref:uncharacterized protein LOC120827889 n=1 Tax=Gasterosteus aculeatus aculeatus TaxID=481459 RepID=UPI001A983461|nr:uncharacterized protein LOC120827889 [Gasterosteus aculeatus aculeatus]
MIWRCVICFVFVALNLKSLLSHINISHSRGPDFRVICGIDGCTKEYRVYNSLWYHITRNHYEHLESGSSNSRRERSTASPEASSAVNAWTYRPTDATVQIREHQTDEAVVENRVQDVMTVGSCPAVDSSASCQSEDDIRHNTLTRQATAIMLTAREKHHLSQRGVNDVLAAMQQYQALLVTNLRSQLQTVFQQHQGSELEKEAMALFDRIEDPFSSVATTYRQDNVIKENFNFVESEEVSVGYTACLKKKGTKRVLSTRTKCFHYVPLIKSIEQLLSHPKVLEMIDQPQKYRSGGYLYDIIDGELMKSHPLFSARPSALQIIIYSDEIEICNPLGSHASKNKLLMFYYTLGNIDPKYRSKLAAIRLLAIAKKRELSDCGVDGILGRLYEDLEMLYDGVNIQTANGEREIFGALVSICGDTLAQHELCGFKEGVGFAYSKCRQCECSFEDMQMYFDENNFELSTLEKHVRQCSDIEKANTEYLRNSLKTTFGINRRSKLIEFPGFNLIEQTPQDLMHIILEGIAPLEIKCVLKQLVLLGQLDLDVLNTALTGFPYSPLDVRDKPSPIAYSTLASTDNKLKQSSGQMIVLLKILPFLIDTAKDTEYYKIILELIEIVKILFAPVIGLQTISKLKRLIEQHLKHMKSLFPDNNIIPKMHYLIHAPSQIKLLGPMVRHMCMRFESKHCFFKQWASKLNFRNVCKSLIRHNQMYECCQNVSHSEQPIFVNECGFGPTSEIRNMSYLKEKTRAFLGTDDIDNAVSVKWINLNGNKYIREKTLLVTAVNSNDLPEFGLVSNIYVINASLYCFELQQHTTVRYDGNYMAYTIEIPNMAQATELIASDNLVDFTPYYSYSHKDVTYVPTKYYLGDVLGLHRASSDGL